MGKNKNFQPARQQQKHNVVHQETSASFVGPLPPPVFFQGYENACPGAAERILKMAEEQSKHRQSLEATVINCQEKRANAGQKFALIISLSCVVACCFCAYVGQPWPASVIGGAALVGGITAFVGGKHKQDKELKAQSDNETPAQN